MRWTIKGYYYLPTGSSGTIDWSTIGEFVCERGGGDDYNTAPVSWANMVHANGNPRWPMGTRIQVYVVDTGASNYEQMVFYGSLAEAKWDGLTGTSLYQFRGMEYLLLRRNDATGSNVNTGAKGTINTILGAWGGSYFAKHTDRFVPNSQVALNRPAQGTDQLNGDYIRSCLYGTSQNLIVRTAKISASTSDLFPAPDRVFDYDVSINGPLDADYWPILGTNMDAQKVRFDDCGLTTGDLYRKWKVKSTVNGTTGTTTATGISTTYLDQNTVIIDGWFKTNTDCTVTGAMLAERQGSDLRKHRIFSMEYRPDVYNDLGGTNSTTLYKLQPGDYIQFTNKPTVTAYNVQTFTHYYDIPAAGSAVTYDSWDVRRVKYTYAPDTGWVYDVGLQARSTDYFSAGTW